MACTFKCGRFTSVKIIVGVMMLLNFGSQLAFGNKGIAFCDKQLNELNADVKDWKKRCMDNKYQEHKTTQCNEEKKYNQGRMRKHTSQCFYEGNYFSQQNM